ncbi:RNA-binding KH domain-containing protein [Raphanus sativus]|uniref:KH domain-containing protein HEN4 isoform X2 n=1 Tax=Raphanus sativus TaxID=3726 RepID=A0A6J0P6H0_RAPSA|nr:KH domain-containing protein HEN4 isoform X2 [Raphanus sativus]KAJ4897279.1 RNA-binding KH domain-containing protein [Raphanus sativus]
MERNSFHYSTEKRSRAVDPGSGFGSSKKAKTHHAHLLSPLVVPVGHASFRLLSAISQVGAVIGKSGSVIKQLQQSTGAKIRVEEPPAGSPDRVITIIAQVDSTSRVKLGVVDSNGSTEVEDEVEVSKAQAALIRVFEILAAEAGSSTVVCRLLTESSHAGAVIGKGGQMVGRIRKETGCKIAIRTENLPVCADSDDEMVEIEGNVNAVKKALVSVSRCLQDCQDVKKIRMVGNRPPLEKETNQESSHRPLETIIQDSLLRRSVEDYDYRPRAADMFPRGTLARPSDVIPHEALHLRHVEDRRHIEEDRQDALRRQIEAERQDALRRHIDLGHREVLYRPSDGVRGDVFLQHREVDTSSHESLHRPYEMVQRDAIRGIPFESLQRDAIRGIPFESLQRDSFGRTIETIPQETLRRPSSDFLTHRSSTLDTHPHSITTSTLMTKAATLKPHQSEVEAENQDVVFKILCSTENAGGVIGTGGKVIRTLHSESGALISVGNTIADCEERLITVTASESPERQSSPAQKAILLVFTRLFELATKKILDNGSRMSITARLVVPTSQIGCLLGKGGAVVSEMRKATGAAIQILKVEQNPKCTSENDQVVQITGEFPNVREAIYHVTSRLRDSLFSNAMKSSVTKSNSTLTTERIHRGQSDNPLSVGSHQSFGHPPTISTSLHRRTDDSYLSGSQLSINYSRPAVADPYTRPEDPVPDRFNPSAGYSPNFGRRSAMDHHDISHHLTETASRMWASPPPAALRGLSDASGGLSSARPGPGHGLGSGHKSAIVTNTTVEIRVPENAMSFVYGEHGNNLEQLRQISGARVIVHEPHLGTSDRIIVISGTPDQTQAAQNLLHAFILKGETSLSKRYNLN